MSFETLSRSPASEAIGAADDTEEARIDRLNARWRLADPSPETSAPSDNVVPLRGEGRAPDRAALINETKAILRQAIVEEFPGRIAIVSSFGAESAVLLHLAASVAPDTPVIFLETGKHFAQTLSYRKKIGRDFGLTDIRDIKSPADELEKADPNGDLWRNDPDACCRIRKVRPLSDALAGFDAWITGRKQFHGGARLSLPVYEATASHMKVNPLARWERDDVTAYFEANDLPRHPLTAQGFPSVGCWPCTKPAGEGEDVRAGRWRGSDKTECGIHSL